MNRSFKTSVIGSMLVILSCLPTNELMEILLSILGIIYLVWSIVLQIKGDSLI